MRVLSRNLFLAASLSLVSPCAPVSGATAAEIARREPVINVTGTGTASVRPDQAILSLSVVRMAKTARAALDDNSAAMRAVLSALAGQGVKPENIQTSQFSVDPQYVYPDNDNGQNRPPEIVGYSVTSQLAVRVTDLARLGAILDQSVTLGVNQGGGISFASSNPEEALKKARAAAVRDAVSRAGTLAAAAGVRLGKLVELTENSYDTGPRPMLKTAMAAPEASDVPVASGENSYTVNVSAVFAIAE